VRRASLLPVLAALTLATPRSAAAAEGGPFGLGIILGSPTGITLKLRLTENHAFQLAAGWGFGPEDVEHFVLTADYLFTFPHAFGVIDRAVSLSPYVGIGGQFGFYADTADLGFRVPLGLSFLFARTPFELFVEIAVGIHLIPSTSGLLDGGIGGRIYF
jgi:hypothetical protein